MGLLEYINVTDWVLVSVDLISALGFMSKPEGQIATRREAMLRSTSLRFTAAQVVSLCARASSAISA